MSRPGPSRCNPVARHHFGPVAFIAEQRDYLAVTKHLAILKPGALEHPMLTVLHAIPDYVSLPVPPATRLGVTATRHAVLRIELLPPVATAPLPKHPLADRLVTYHRRVVVHVMDPEPTAVAGEKCDVAALFDVLGDIPAHRLGPVLVVADTEHEVVVAQQVGLTVQIPIRAIVKGVPERSTQRTKGASQWAKVCLLDEGQCASAESFAMTMPPVPPPGRRVETLTLRAPFRAH